jgi:hypothetical protein
LGEILGAAIKQRSATKSEEDEGDKPKKTAKKAKAEDETSEDKPKKKTAKKKDEE